MSHFVTAHVCMYVHTCSYVGDTPVRSGVTVATMDLGWVGGERGRREVGWVLCASWTLVSSVSGQVAAHSGHWFYSLCCNWAL